MAPAGDFDTFSTIMDFYLQTVPFNSARTKEYFGHEGIFYTETKTLFGAFGNNDYGAPAGTAARGDLPVYLESNGYIHYDYGGNAGGTEVSMMILDHFLYSQSKAALNKYFPVVNLTLQFFHDHYKNRTADGQLVIWPTQALETYWYRLLSRRLFVNSREDPPCLSCRYPLVMVFRVHGGLGGSAASYFTYADVRNSK